MVTNAQAAQRLIRQPPADLGELREILSDIVQAGQRGANVIRGVRGLLRRADSDQVAVDMNTLVREVAGLLQSDAILERMFVPFFTTKPAGLGLGLSISRTIVRAHGGAIRAVRHAERGSTISLTLPTFPWRSHPARAKRYPIRRGTGQVEQNAPKVVKSTDERRGSSVAEQLIRNQ